jgi:hypothetical protein
MADLAHDGMYRVTWVPGGCANRSTPTITELEGGVDLECRLTPTGLTREASTERKDTSKLCSTFSTQSSGRRSFNLQVVAVREEGDTAGVEAALFYRAIGDLVIRDDKLATEPWSAGDQTAVPPAPADKVEVYPAQCDQPSKSAPAANEDQTITVGFAMTADPVLDATVTAA